MNFCPKNGVHLTEMCKVGKGTFQVRLAAMAARAIRRIPDYLPIGDWYNHDYI
jgi:hypothetical protein